jgi:N6-L-threonylcarbamoyladenine synthase
VTLCLGIETSCDETALALVRDGRLLAQRIATQIDAHAVFGGVVPELASREHLRALGPLLDGLTADAGVRLGELDAVCVARGPGLLGSLLVGLSLAKGIVLATGAALVGVNHLQAHLLAPALERPIAFPALGLLVSGGHTQTYRMDSPTAFATLGRTLDDAAGEAFDKAAKTLNLPYPGGRFIDLLGRMGEADPALFPRPYVANDSLDFSFSGLKTAMVNHVAAHPDLRAPALTDDLDALVADLRARGALEPLARTCASYTLAVADTLRIKTARALDANPGMRSLVVAGGVAANSVVRRTMAELAAARGLDIVLPPLALCTDNAAMIALAGEFLFHAGYRHGLDLDAVPRGRRIPWDYRQVRPHPA